MASPASNRMRGLLMLGILLSPLAGVRHASAISPRVLVEVADFGSPVVSPDGRYVAFRIEQASIERNTYDTVWYVQDMEGGLPARRVADGGVPLRDTAGLSVPAAAVWSPDGRWIYYRARVDRQIDVWRAATDGSGAEPVTRDSADVRGFSLGAEGRALRYTVGASREEVLAAELAEYHRGIRIEENSTLGQSLFRSGLIEGRLATQRLGPWFTRVSLLDDVVDRWKVVDLATHVRRDLAASEVPPLPLNTSDLAIGWDEPWKLALDADSGRIALLTRVGEKHGLRDGPDVVLSMLADKNARHAVTCQAAMCVQKAISDVQWRPGTDEILFTVTDYDEGYAQSIFRWNVHTGVVRPVATSDGLISGEGRWAPGHCGVSATALACIASEANGPPRLERIDLETGERRVLFAPNEALARTMESSAPVRMLRWRDAAGRQFTGQYFPARRTGDAPSPLFVTYYSCAGFLRGGSGDEWPLAVLAANGVAAICINALPYRFNAAERYDAGRSAVESVVGMLSGEGEVDPSKVAMGGLSFGAETTLWTLMHSDLLAAASIATPGISQQYYLMGSNRGRPFLEGVNQYWQVEAPDSKQWSVLSPTDNLDSMQAPILMQLPEQEFSRAWDYAIPLMRDHRADVYVYPNEPHIKFQPRHKLAIYERNVDWFRFWLQGVVDPAPAKRAQYSHWRLMREHQAARSARTAASSR